MGTPMTFRSNEELFADLLDTSFEAQRLRVRRIAWDALRTPGARLSGLLLWVFAPVFARWFVEGIEKRCERPAMSPFVYTMR